MSDGNYTVRLEDETVSVDEAGLRELVEAGRVSASTPVALAGGPFARADQVDALAGSFGGAAPTDDPWGVWDELDEDEDEEDVLDEVTSHEESVPEPVAEAGLPPVEPEEPATDEVPTVEPESLDEDEIEEVEPDPPPKTRMVIEGGRKERGQVIDFPGRRPGRRSGGAEPARKLERLGAQDLTPLPEPKRRPPRAPEPRRQREVEPESAGFQARHFYLLALLVVGLSGVGLYIWYVTSTATWTSADPLGHGMGTEPALTLADQARVEAQTEPPPLLEPEQEGDVLAPVVEDLKATMVHDIADISSAEQDSSAFEDALFAELSKLGLIATLDLEVLGWREDGVPGVVSLTVDVRSRGDSSRELGAVALVVGKYVDFHDLTVRGFTVRLIDEDAGTAKVAQLDPDKAAALYQDRMGLVEVLGLE